MISHKAGEAGLGGDSVLERVMLEFSSDRELVQAQQNV